MPPSRLHVDTSVSSEPPTPRHCSPRADTVEKVTTIPRRRLSCSSPRCSSPCASAEIPCPPQPMSPPMSMNTYFGLLKKSQVLEQLLRLSGHASAREIELRRLESEKTRADCVHARVFADLALFQSQFVDAQKCALEIVEQLTSLCLPSDGDASSEEHTLRDLQRAVSATSSTSPRKLTSTGLSTHSLDGFAASIETEALRAVGRDRVRQLSNRMEQYERQLVGLEAELSRTIHSSAIVDLRARVQELETREKQQSNENAELKEQLRRSLGQQRDLQARVDQLRDETVSLDTEKRLAEQELQDQGMAIEQFGVAIKNELRRRHGFVSSTADAHYDGIIWTDDG